MFIVFYETDVMADRELTIDDEFEQYFAKLLL